MVLIVALWLLHANIVYAACSRQSLVTVRDNFFNAGAKNDTQSVKLSPNTTIALNNKVVPDLASTPFTNLTGFTAFKVEAIDTTNCQIGTFRVSDSQVLSTRLRVNDEGIISEVEFLQAVNGDQFFKPSGFPSTTPPLWTTNQTAGNPPSIPPTWSPIGGTPQRDVNTATCRNSSAPARLLTRRELIYTAATYTDGLKGDPWASCVLGGSSCPRNENGVITTQNCAVGTGRFNFLTRGRRWVADTETAVVLGAFYFDYGGTPPSDAGVGLGFPVPGAAPGNATKLFLHEYFKVEAGLLAGIYAPMKNIPGPQASAGTFMGEV